MEVYSIWIEMKRDADNWDEEGYDHGGMYGLRWRKMLFIEMSRGSVIMEVCTVWLRRRELLIIGMRRGLWLWRYIGFRWRSWGWGEGLIMEVYRTEMKRAADHWDEARVWYGVYKIEIKWPAGHWDEESVWLWRYVWMEMKRAADHWDVYV